MYFVISIDGRKKVNFLGVYCNASKNPIIKSRLKKSNYKISYDEILNLNDQ